ncbi:allantoate deiminase [Gracilibacillus oryzae]|uniref:allantoate deiminase n=1 Tax=Gracilibacillus oryzae TaxID=1672701 RepID=UPI003898DD6D
MTITTKNSPFSIEDTEPLLPWLSSFGQSEGGGVSRLLYTPSWLEAQLALKQKMEQSGLHTYFDSVGNLFGRLEGKQDTVTILTGSHIDSVINGGKYDGTYGIIASFLAAQLVYQKYGKPKKNIEVVSLCEEEGSRFPLTFWGSGNITGKYSITDANNIHDANSVSLRTAMNEADFNPEHYQSPVRKDLEAFIELHVEQGIILDRTRTSLGIVDSIVGQRRFTVQISGESNHAGTTPMSYRKDSLYFASKYIYFLTNKAMKLDQDLVITAGKMNVMPNTPNVIPGNAEFTLDIRHHDEAVLETFCNEARHTLDQMAKELTMCAKMSKWLDIKPVPMNTPLTALATKIAKEQQISYRKLMSGAGHDAQVFGEYCPTALLFVPSKDGISHSPKEFTNKADLENGVRILTEFLYQLAY